MWVCLLLKNRKLCYPLLAVSYLSMAGARAGAWNVLSHSDHYSGSQPETVVGPNQGWTYKPFWVTYHVRRIYTYPPYKWRIDVYVFISIRQNIDGVFIRRTYILTYKCVFRIPICEICYSFQFRIPISHSDLRKYVEKYAVYIRIRRIYTYTPNIYVIFNTAYVYKSIYDVSMRIRQYTLIRPTLV